MQGILSTLRRAVDHYGMIEDGDVISVGVSGGKDSMTLLAGLSELRLFYPKKYRLRAITLDMGFMGSDFSEVAEFCARHGVPHTLVKTEIGEIIFGRRKERSPCSLCARMRRGALHDAAKELGCNKIALGHTFDDTVETFMLCLMYEGRVGCFSPVTYLDRKDITMIRPLIYTDERDIQGFVKRYGVPIFKNPCPVDGYTKRTEVKDLLAELERNNQGLRERIFGAIERGDVSGFHR